MKPLLTLFFIFSMNSFLPVSNVFCSEDYPKAAKLVENYLSRIEFEVEISSDTSIRINFTVNDSNEIVVLTVDTPSNSIRRTIKSTLNNKKIGAGDLIPGKEYSFVLAVKGS
jgi:hypothetical protein